MPSPTSRLLAGLCLSPTFFLAIHGAASAAENKVEPAVVEGGQISQVGWWSRLNEPLETGLLVLPDPPAVGVPAGTLPVSVLGGDLQRMSAIEFAIDAEPDDTVSSVVVTLRESADATGSPNAAGALISACPVTDAFWVGAENEPWANRPAYDCEEGVEVTREEPGAWTFDLTDLATTWLSAESTASPAVMLVAAKSGERGEPLTFQVAFDGVEAEGIGLLAEVEAAAEEDEDAESGDTKAESTTTTEDTDQAGSPVGGGSSSSTGSPLGSSGTASSGGDLGDLGDLGASSAPLPDTTVGAIDTASSAAAPVTDGGVGTIQPVSAGTPSWHQGLSKASFLLVPLMLALAYLAMVAMGPTAQPSASTGRRGVSKALDRLRAAGNGIAVKAGR